MKSHSSNGTSSLDMSSCARMSPSPNLRSGVALVVVLFIIVLVVGLLVAFLNMVKTERASTASFLATSEVRQLADSAVGIVKSQINHATTRGKDFAWISQPGMVRTYAKSGTLDRAYKLYSAQTLTTETPSTIADDLPPANWADSPAIWTDINAPITVDNTTTFPIFDPAAALDTTIDRRVKGISITGAPGATARQPAPMPVRWLYVLQDGQIVSPTSSSGSVVTAPGANSGNPIVGRIAFWTDDDTCKVNINTAGVGSYWDTPHFNTTEDRKFATSQPLNGEFQRYPGHPAMTDLTAVFPNLQPKDILERITPRYQWGGSEQGEVDTYSKINALANGQLADKPLLASVDEIQFTSDKTSRSNNAQLDRAMLQKAKFFLTATSRAPELNLFNLPRIACWPISTDPTGRTAFDRVIAHCSTISGYPYYFQRSSALSPTEDASIFRNTELFSYLQKLSSETTPGFGASLASKYRVDRDQILVEIWDYIRATNLFDSRLPAGKSFTPNPSATSTKPGHGYVVPLEVNSEGVTYRGFGRAMTISELAFLFICTADSVDIVPASGTNGLLNSNDPEKNRTLNATKLDPLKKERRIQMMMLPEFFSPSLGDVLMAPKNFRLRINGLSTLKVNDQLLFPNDSATLTILDTGFNEGITHSRRSGGAFDYRALLRSSGKPLCSPLNWDGGGQIYPFISEPVTVQVSGSPDDPGNMTFSTGVLSVTIESSTNGSSWETLQTFRIVPPASSSIPVPNLVRTGGPAAGSASNPIPGTDPNHWWSFSLASPWEGGGTGGRLFAVDSGPNLWRVSSQGIPYSESGEIRPASLIRGRDTTNSNPAYTDVVRSMVPAHGDYRLIAALKNIPEAAFTPLGNWSNGGAQNALIHTLGIGLQRASDVAGGSKYRRHFTTISPIGSTATSYGAGGAYAPDFRIDASSAVLTALADRGDFDNPSACWPDGPFINKPDEGNVYSDATYIPYFGVGSTEINSTAFFSPNRIIAGPGMFGSLPTHVQRYFGDAANPEKYAWTTLLFRKQPGHPNALTSPPDHLWMDYFWMPTVEPYAISEPFATAGKINMNYLIQPFTYIKRTTALVALMQSEKIPAIPNASSATYKAAVTANPVAVSYRQAIDPQATLTQFDARFDQAKTTGQLFLSATELCDLWLVPQGQQATDASMQAYWSDHKLTGDNLRERPYTNLIPRLTTKSNTYTVHFRVQRLKPSDPAKWDENKSATTAEYRGSTTIERFLDPNATYPDYASNPEAQPSLDTFYRWRVVENRQFAP